MNVSTLTARAFVKVPASLKRVVTFTRSTPGSVDPVTDTPSAATESTSGGRFVVASPGTRSMDSGLDGFKAGEMVRENARVLIGVLHPDAAFTPVAGDTATWDSATWNVLSALDLGGGAVRVAVTR